MFADAVRQLRFHPGRFVATLLAIAISVGFMAAVSIFMATQTSALGKMLALPTSRADVVVTANSTTGTADQLKSAITGVPGVDAVERSRSVSLGLSKGTESAFVEAHVLPSERFRWARLASGAWPYGPLEIAVSQQVADTLKAKVGDSLEAGPMQLRIVGISADAPTLFIQTAYVSPMFGMDADSATSSPAGSWLVALKPGTDAAASVSAIDRAVQPYRGAKDTYPGAKEPITVGTASDTQHEATLSITRDFDVMKYLLLAFSGIAALVGMIIIANTFTILLAQRRRQIGLLRAVGASGRQVRGRFLAEAVLLGFVGSVVGLALGTVAGWIGASVTKASFFGLVLPWSDLAIEVGIGVLVTMLAAMLPALRATRVLPLEALQPVATSEQVRKASVVRAVITGLLIVAGVGLAAVSQLVEVDSGNPSLVGPLLLAVAGAMLLTIGVLGAAPLYIPALLRGLGVLIGRNATARLAADNAVRNPSRAAATATALMLATGLIVTLQVGTATAEKTMLTEIEKTFPIDLTVTASLYSPDPGDDPNGGPTASSSGRLSASVLDKVKLLPNIKASAVLSGGAAKLNDEPVMVVALTPDVASVSSTIGSVADGVVLLNGGDRKDGDRVTLAGASGPITLTVKKVSWVAYNQAVVSQANLTKLVATPAPQAVWLKLADASQIGSTMKAAQTLQSGGEFVDIGGSAPQSYMIQEVLRILLLITTALLGAAVLIALIGVGNTLGLSVIERARESALLRALGMQKASLRTMLLVEAVLLALAGVLVGVAAGCFFGWLGIASIVRQSAMDTPLQFAVDLPLTLGMLVVAFAAAALASVLPGRRAANATPTEALAAD